MSLLKLLYEKSGHFIAGIMIAALLISNIPAFFSLFPKFNSFTSWGVEREGTIKFDDCREIIFLSPDTSQKLSRDFTCTYVKTNNGVLLNSMCARVEMDSTDKICKRAFTYNYNLAKYGGGCRSDSAPYLGYDDRCHLEPR